MADKQTPIYKLYDDKFEGMRTMKKSLHSLSYINGFDEGHEFALSNIVPQLEKIHEDTDDNNTATQLEDLIKELTDETSKG